MFKVLCFGKAIDGFVLNRGRPARKAFGVLRLSLGLFAMSILAVLLGIGLAAQRAADQARRAPEGSTVLPVEGTPFQATVPDGWHQMAAPDSAVLFEAGDASEDVAISFSAVRVIDLPTALQEPRRSTLTLPRGFLPWPEGLANIFWCFSTMHTFEKDAHATRCFLVCTPRQVSIHEGVSAKRPTLCDLS